MMKFTKPLILLCAMAPLISFGATDASTNSTPKPVVDIDSLFTNSVVAKGTGVYVTRDMLDREVINSKAMLAQRGYPTPQDIDDQVLETIIGKQLVLAKATPEDRAKGKEEFNKTIEKIKTNSKLTDEQFNQKLAQQMTVLNITKEEWEKQSAEQVTIPIVLQRELAISISDSDVKKYYEENPAKFEMPEMVHAAHILMMTVDPATGSELSDDKKAAKKKQLEDVLKRAKAGEAFGKLAKEFSEDPGSKDNGGEYTFPKGQMVPEFESTAFSLGTNQISDIITTKFGYHIIKLYAKSPSHQAQLDDDVVVAPAQQGGYIVIKKYWLGAPEMVAGTEKLSAIIRQALLNERMAKGADEYVRKLRKDAKIEITDAKLKSAIESREKMINDMKAEENAETNAPKAATTPK